MKAVVGLALVAAVGLVAGPSASSGRQTDRDQTPQEPTFRSVVDSVAVDVSVTNGSAVVTNLAVSDFHLLDNGIQQEIVTASYGKVPIDVTVALDVSYSERGAPLARLRRGVLELSAGLVSGDRLRLIAFNEDVRRVLDFTANQQEIEAAVQALSASGGTSIFDALTTALVAPPDPARRQLVTIFTDGIDTASFTEPPQLLETGRRERAAVTVVMSRPSPRMPPLVLGALTLQTAGPAPPRSESPLLRQLTDLTGGRVIVDHGPPADLGPVFRLALDTFRSSYVLFFSPRGVDRAGFHTLRVSIPDHPQYTIRARPGYFGS